MEKITNLDFSDEERKVNILENVFTLSDMDDGKLTYIQTNASKKDIEKAIDFLDEVKFEELNPEGYGDLEILSYYFQKNGFYFKEVKIETIIW